MKKHLVNLTEQQLAWLREEAEALGIGVAELLRRIIDEARHRQSSMGHKPKLDSLEGWREDPDHPGRKE